MIRNYRGKATCSDKWAYGCYVECDGGYYIIEKLGGHEGAVAKIQVHPKSVGQQVGLKDKNGKEIYAGDICKNGDWVQDDMPWNYREEVVRWDKENCMFIGWNHNKNGMSCEIIGNIHSEAEA